MNKTEKTVRIIVSVMAVIALVAWIISSSTQGWDTVGILGFAAPVAMICMLIVAIFYKKGNEK